MGLFLTNLVVEEISKRNWRLHEPLRYQRGTSGEIIEVPTGFVTDFASVPRWVPFAYVIFKDEGRKAATIHDYYYRVVGKSKHEADMLFYGALRDSPDVPLWKIYFLYWAVCLLGGFSWKEDKAKKDALCSAINPANTRTMR